MDAILLLRHACFRWICMTYIGLTLERFCGVWVFTLKEVHNVLLYEAGQFYIKKQDGG